MLNTTTSEFAGLDCLVIDALLDGRPPTQLVILCHGFGDTMNGLGTFAPYLLEADDHIAASCRFVFPNAPMDLTRLGIPGGRGWWEINMARLAMMHQTKNFEELTELTPDGLLAASEQLASAVREIQKASNLSDSAMTIGGFSQGAMITTDLVLRRGFVPKRLCVFSGTLLCRDEWKRFAAKHSGCPVLQSHGRRDLLLPFEPAESLRDMLTENGFPVTFRPFNADHTIPMEVVEQLADYLAATT